MPSDLSNLQVISLIKVGPLEQICRVLKLSHSMSAGVPLERIQVQCADHQALNNLIATYVIGYDDCHDGKLSQ